MLQDQSLGGRAGGYFYWVYLLSVAMTSGSLRLTTTLWGETFTYPSDNLALDLALLFIMAVLEAVRIYLSTKGNLTEEEKPLAIGLVLTIGSIFLSVYFLVWETYTLRADVILNALLLALYGLELILGLFAIAAFVR
ncbi:transmembrane protein 80 isoform X3 [Pleurodeles waltl]|uniref:transmembrane protein 80 isoform X3 n=1 Tax=Pleurodeles waltl TaxID=8319 RepID=UPI0037097058